jgi:hypothetical protein
MRWLFDSLPWQVSLSSEFGPPIARELQMGPMR